MPVNRKLQNLLDGRNMKVIADDNTIGGMPMLYRIDMAGGATATSSITLAETMVVVDFWCVLKGAGTTSDTVQLFADAVGLLAITDALDISGSDSAVVGVGTIDDDYMSTDYLTVKETDGGGSDSPACVCYILAYKA